VTKTRLASLAQALPGKVRLDEPMAKHTSFKIGGPAEVWAEPANEAELLACLAAAKQAGAPVTILTGGTNVLVRDGGIPGLVLSLGAGFEDLTIQGTNVHAGAGINLALLTRKVSLAGLQGLAWAIGIPGTLGGGLVMNAGAHGGELKDVVTRVRVIVDGVAQDWSAADCGFAYRHSKFKEQAPGSCVIVSADLALKAGNLEALKLQMDEALNKRKATQPLELPNAGCVFKNPEGASAGKLIEDCGLKGRQQGWARISDKHANFVVNLKGAKASDVLALMEVARKAVKEKHGIELKNEILILGVDEK
jgi:UDP-N-acetylmuramate dehydrogenase